MTILARAMHCPEIGNDVETIQVNDVKQITLRSNSSDTAFSASNMLIIYFFGSPVHILITNLVLPMSRESHEEM